MAMIGTNYRFCTIDISFSIEHLDDIIDDPLKWEAFRVKLRAYYLSQKERLQDYQTQKERLREE